MIFTLKDALTACNEFTKRSTSPAMTQRYIEGDTEAKRKLVALL